MKGTEKIKNKMRRINKMSKLARSDELKVNQVQMKRKQSPISKIKFLACPKQ
jgi:hypothetical protein